MKKIVEKTVRSQRIDQNTGEVIQDIETITIGHPGRPVDLNFLKVYPAFFSSFLKQLKIDDGKARLVLFLMFKAIELKTDSDNVIIAKNDEIMKALNISKPTLLSYIKQLCELKVIERLSPRMPVYRINPNMIYKGTLTKYYQQHICG